MCLSVIMKVGKEMNFSFPKWAVARGKLNKSDQTSDTNFIASFPSLESPRKLWGRSLLGVLHCLYCLVWPDFLEYQ